MYYKVYGDQIAVQVANFQDHHEQKYLQKQKH